MQIDLRIKKAGIEDMQVIVALAKEIWPATYRGILSADQISYMMQLFYEPASLREQMTEKHHQFLIAESERKPVAFASYGPHEDARVYKLHKIYVHPSVQQQGVGKAIIEYIVQQLRQLGATSLELNVNRNNKAKRFYEKIGFSISREENIDIGSGYFMNDYVLTKSLDNSQP